jgi:hypothetical protein
MGQILLAPTLCEASRRDQIVIGGGRNFAQHVPLHGKIRQSRQIHA